MAKSKIQFKVRCLKFQAAERNGKKMKIMDQKVEHKKFGMGKIFALKDQKVYVTFGKIFGDKSFPFPEVFVSDMKMCDEDAQEEIMEDIKMMNRRKEQ